MSIKRTINIDCVNMACPETASVLSLEFQPCIHLKDGKKFITSVKDSTTFTHLFESYHDCQNNSKEAEFTVSAQNQTRIHGSLSVGEVVRNFSLRSFLFICKTTDDPELNKLQQYAANATKKAVNAFELLMAGGRSIPDKKRSRYVSNYKQSTWPCIQFQGHFIYRYQAANVGYIFVSILKRLFYIKWF